MQTTIALSMVDTQPDPARQLMPEPMPHFTPEPTPPHQPTTKKAARIEPTAVPLPTRRSKRKVEAAEPQPPAEQLRDQEEYDYYLVQHCEVNIYLRVSVARRHVLPPAVFLTSTCHLSISLGSASELKSRFS